MQSLDVISLNIWQILISLCNLIILFFILKKFLFKPVHRVMAQRKSELDTKYQEADKAQEEADRNRLAWEEKMKGAQAEADTLLKKATADAGRKSEKIVSDAREKADAVISGAKTQAELEYKKAQSEIKEEIVDVSALLTEKILQREINTEDHRAIIDSVISEIGETDDGDK